MKFLNKLLALFLLFIFSAYSIGVFFSVHSCEHCQKKIIYIFKHPDCCAASWHEHHEQTIHEEHAQFSCCSSKHNYCHKTCCVSEFKYFKLHKLYTQPNIFHLDSFIFLSINLSISEFVVALNNNAITLLDKAPPTPDNSPISQGGDMFLIFTHQQVLYA